MEVSVDVAPECMQSDCVGFQVGQVRTRCGTKFVMRPWEKISVATENSSSSNGTIDTNKVSEWYYSLV